MDIKLRLVRVYLGEHRLDVGMEDLRTGEPRVVQYRWAAKDATDVPPLGWFEAVVGEVEFQRADELNPRPGL
jgi:hypothetical protein